MKHLASRITALLLLVCYGTVSTPLGALVFLGLADHDSAHEVRVVTAGRSMQVVLHHGAGGYTPRVGDHAGSVTRLLTSMCKTDGCGDHVFQQEASTPAKEEQSKLTPSRAAQKFSATTIASYEAVWSISALRDAGPVGILRQATPPKLKRPLAGMGATSLLV